MACKMEGMRECHKSVAVDVFTVEGEIRQSIWYLSAKGRRMKENISKLRAVLYGMWQVY